MFGSLSWNSLDENAAEHLAKGLKKNTALTSLKYAAAHPFAYCQQPLTPDQHSPLLLAHSLARNEIQDAGAKALGEALTTNKSLTSLEYAATRPLAPDITDIKVSAAADTSV